MLHWVNLRIADCLSLVRYQSAVVGHERLEIEYLILVLIQGCVYFPALLPLQGVLRQQTDHGRLQEAAILLPQQLYKVVHLPPLYLLIAAPGVN